VRRLAGDPQRSADLGPGQTRLHCGGELQRLEFVKVVAKRGQRLQAGLRL
jgi:hypothetical protein